MSTVTLADYSKRLAQGLNDANAIARFSPAGNAFLRRLLSIDPTRRPTASQALKDPWFTGVDLAKAQEYVNRFIGQFIHAKTSDVIRGAKKRGNANADRNTNLSAYIRIEPADVSDTLWKPWIGEEKRNLLKLTVIGRFLNFLVAPVGWTLPILLHAFELAERVANITFDGIGNKFFACLGIARKLSELYTPTGSQATLRSIKSIFTTLDLAVLQAEERNVIKLLGGDLFIQKGGLAEQFVKEVIQDRSPTVGAKYECLRSLLFLVCYAISESNSTNIKPIVEDVDAMVKYYKQLESNFAAPSPLTARQEERRAKIQAAALTSIFPFLSFLDSTVFSPNAVQALLGHTTPTGLTNEKMKQNLLHFHASILMVQQAVNRSRS
jgi:hypothetical protein